MPSFDPDIVHVDGLEKLMKAVKGPHPVARIGILGTKTNRTAEKAKTANNATIGAAHEYGSLLRGLPIRSFLRVPISEKLQGELEKAGMFTDEETKEVIRSGSLMAWLRKAVVLAEAIVKGAFDTRGYGRWPKWKNPRYQNNTGMVLVDTTQLRDSVTSEVKEAK